MTQKHFLRLLLLPLAAGLLLPLRAQDSKSSASAWEPSLVSIEATHKTYESFQPWVKRTRAVTKTGVVIGPREILTTAEEMNDVTLVRIQKGGRGKWFPAQIAWVDYHANLLILTSDDATLWPGLKPAEFATGKPAKDGLQIVRWKNGNVEARKAEFNQFTVEDGRLTFISHLQLDVSTDMAGVGWAEPVVAGRKIVGIAAGSTGNNIRAIPAAFITPILDARKKGNYRGLGWFPFVWSPAENPSVHKFLKAEGEPRGVVVLDVPNLPGDEPVLQPRDLILQLDGFDVDIQGYYKDPDFGQLLVENLASRRKFAGDEVKLKVWREGKTLDLKYKMPKADYSAKLVPDHGFDREPEYLIAGGLIFQPLTVNYLRGFGADWKRTAPFRLNYYTKDSPTKDRPGLVVLSLVLPDAYNLGYQESRYLVVDQVNGRKISRITDLDEAFKKPVNGFHIVELARSDSLRRIVLDAATLDAATARVVQRYQIPKDRVIHKAGANSVLAVSDNP